MSDYGALIELVKINKLPVSKEEMILIEKEIEKIKLVKEFADSLGEKFLFELNEVDGEAAMLLVKLSEYWDDGKDEEEATEDFEFAKENDFDIAKEIAELLSKSVGHLFEVKTIFDGW